MASAPTSSGTALTGGNFFLCFLDIWENQCLSIWLQAINFNSLTENPLSDRKSTGKTTLGHSQGNGACGNHKPVHCPLANISCCSLSQDRQVSARTEGVLITYQKHGGQEDRGGLLRQTSTQDGVFQSLGIISWPPGLLLDVWSWPPYWWRPEGRFSLPHQLGLSRASEREV